MKRIREAGTDGLSKKNRQDLDQYMKTEEGKGLILSFMFIVAEMLDYTASGDLMWMSIGTTKDRSAFMVSLHGEAVPAPVYAASWHSLLKLMQPWA